MGWDGRGEGVRTEVGAQTVDQLRDLVARSRRVVVLWNIGGSTVARLRAACSFVITFGLYHPQIMCVNK